MLPGDADRETREPECFPEMPTGKRGSQSASRRCRPGNAGARVLPRDADRETREPECFPEMLTGKRGSQSASRRCRPGNAGARVLPGDAVSFRLKIESRAWAMMRNWSGYR